MIARLNVEQNRGRGSIMYIKNSLNYKELHLGEDVKDYEEAIFVEIKLNHDQLLCGNIYRRGESSETNNGKLLSILRNLCEKKYSHIAIMGDFNLRNINWEHYSCPGDNLDDYSHQFIECIRDCFLSQHVTEPTRKRGQDTQSVLDLIFTNEENMIDDLEFLSPLGHSDHSILNFSIPCQIEHGATKIKVQYEKGDYNALNEYIKNIRWEEEFSKYPLDVNEQWDFFKNILQKAEEKYIPRKTVYVNGKKNKKLSTPLDRKTIQKIKKKNRLLSKLRMNFALVEEELQYNRLRNKIRRLTRKRKKIMEQKNSQKCQNKP